MWRVQYTMRGFTYEQFFRSEREARQLYNKLEETRGYDRITISFVEDSED